MICRIKFNTKQIFASMSRSKLNNFNRENSNLYGQNLQIPISKIIKKKTNSNMERPSSDKFLTLASTIDGVRSGKFLIIFYYTKNT